MQKKGMLLISDLQFRSKKQFEMCAKIKHFFGDLILAHKKYDKKVGFVGFLGIANSKKYRTMEKRGYLLFFLLGLACVFTLYEREKTKTPNNTVTVNKRLSRPNKDPIKKSREITLEIWQRANSSRQS